MKIEINNNGKDIYYKINDSDDFSADELAKAIVILTALIDRMGDRLKKLDITEDEDKEIAKMLICGLIDLGIGG